MSRFGGAQTAEEDADADTHLNRPPFSLIPRNVWTATTTRNSRMSAISITDFHQAGNLEINSGGVIAYNGAAQVSAAQVSAA